MHFESVDRRTATRAGGSSSGPGASAATGVSRMALGSDIRGPAAQCGTVGMKSICGRVSRRGLSCPRIGRVANWVDSDNDSMDSEIEAALHNALDCR